MPMSSCGPTTLGREVVIGGGWYQLSRFETRLQNDYSRTIATPDHEGFQASMSDYMYDVDPSPFVGNDRDEDGYGWGYLAQEAFDNDIPSKPALSYTGVAGFLALRHLCMTDLKRN